MAGSLLKDKPLDLAEGDRLLKELERQRQELEAYIGKMESILKEETSPERIKLREMASKAQLLEGQAEFEQAIDLYQQIIKQGGNEAEVRKRLDKLVQEWKPKSDAHQQARDFIYKKWASAQTAAQMKPKLQELKKSFQVCRDANDHLTPQRLHLLNVGLVAKLEKEAETLHPQDNDDDRRTAEAILEITKELKSLNAEVRGYLKAETKN
jgi:hypothetical protein